MAPQVRVLPGGESVSSHHGPEAAASLRDALAKAVYTRLFDWAVEAVNGALEPAAGDPDVTLGSAAPEDGHRTIGVLDIFGFEDQRRNGFEQLFINTTNESLQAVFNEQIFRAEAEEYVREEILWDATVFPDNSPTIELLEKKPLGLLAVLDSECRLGASASDGAALVRAFGKHHERHPSYEVPSGRARAAVGGGGGGVKLGEGGRGDAPGGRKSAGGL